MRQIILGVVLASLGTFATVLGLWTAGLPLVVFGALIAGLGVVVRISGDAVPLVNRAYNALLLGRAAEAEALLDRAETGVQLAYIRRLVDLQRAGIAVRRGDLDAGLARVEAAIARPASLLARGQERVNIVRGRALRALIRASRGDLEGARADAGAVRADPEAPPDALARAEVALAVALDRAGDRDALAAHLAGKRSLLFDHTVPRERAIVRAFQRMLKAPKASVYRVRAERDPDPPGAEPTEPGVADWIARIAPSAAPFVRSVPNTANGVEAEKAPAGRAGPDLVRAATERLASRQGAGRTRIKVLALWVLLIMFFLAIWQLLSPETPANFHAVAPPTDASPFFSLSLLLYPSLLAGAVGVWVLRIRRNLRHERHLACAVSALARDDARAPAELEALTLSPYGSVAAQAHFQLARLAERRADLDEALKRCDQGIAAATTTAATRMITSSILLPDLVAERAFILSATDHEEKAGAEMAALSDAFPAYPYQARAELRVAMVQRVRRGDLEGAARLVARGTDDVPLPLRDETLADLVRAVARPDTAGAGEVHRLKEELRQDPGLRRWLETTASAALQAFEAPAATGGDDEDRDAQAEQEALAEEESRKLTTEARRHGERE
jgi:hypothetical protein